MKLITVRYQMLVMEKGDMDMTMTDEQYEQALAAYQAVIGGECNLSDPVEAYKFMTWVDLNSVELLRTWIPIDYDVIDHTAYGEDYGPRPLTVKIANT